MDYKDTLLMPKTEFQMRGQLGIKEPEIQKYWASIDLYNKVLKQNEGAIPFILHDGPPYANNNIHIGHAFQKTLKDFVLRYKTMCGFYVPYIPGWDTHGLPIENEVTKKLNRKTTEPVAFRDACHDFALKQVEKQKLQFMRLGILGDWEHPYLTLDKDFEADQIRVFADMVDKGLIYRGQKPVYWSPSSETALAEAEIEYIDKVDKSIYITFEIMDNNKLPELKGVKLLVWTTTPWTLPANLACCVNPGFEYTTFINKDNKQIYLVLKSLLPKLVDLFEIKNYEIIKTYKGALLENICYKHNLYDRISPIICGEHVLDTDGTGIVHTAPGHGEDDFRVGKAYKLDVLCPVDHKGFMTEKAGKYAGVSYSEANDLIIEDLQKNGSLLKCLELNHSYPHDWRTKKPIIFRATPQWFASIDKIKDRLLDAIEKVEWIPKWGEVRLSNMIKDREDWCISRQRLCGVPIPIFYCEDGSTVLDKEVINHVSNLFEEFGSNIWYLKEASELLPQGYTNSASPNHIFTKEKDIMDVWFDSGTSFKVLQRRGIKYPADLYLEGSDQYRGWFNSSLINGVSTTGISPYKKIVSHGFVLDGQGRKMSKSLGNTIDPLQVINVNGADILRLWTASVAYQGDVRISNDALVQVSEAYRKIRNTLKFLLGNLHGFSPKKDYTNLEERLPLDICIVDEFNLLVNQVLEFYENYEFDKIYRNVLTFIINRLSAYYLDYTKDILYIEKLTSKKRLSVVSSIYDITLGLLKILTPIIPHTTSDAYSKLEFEHLEDIYLEKMPSKTVFSEDSMKRLEKFSVFEKFRLQILKALEEARNDKLIGKSLQATLKIILPIDYYNEIQQCIDNFQIDLAQVLMVAKVELLSGDEQKIEVQKNEGCTCERCWNVFDKLENDNLCERCTNVLSKI